MSPIKPTAPRQPNTLANYTIHYNPDITTQDRNTLLHSVEVAAANEARKTLDEGNPMVYLDYLAPPTLTAASTMFEDIMHPTDSVSENFIFSIPSPRKQKASPTKSSPPKAPSSAKRLSNVGVAPATTPLPSTQQAPGTIHRHDKHRRVEPGFVVLNLANQELHPASPLPAFRIVGQFALHQDALDRAQHIEAHENTHSYRSYALKPDHPVEFFIVATARHVLVPPSLDKLSAPDYCSNKLREYLHDHGNLNKLKASFRQLNHGGTPTPDEAAVASPQAIETIMHDMCGQLECLCLAPTTPSSPPTAALPNEPPKNVKKQALQLQDVEHNHLPVELKQAKCNFACISTLLVGDGAEPSLCVYGCFPTEAEASDFAENGFPNELSDQALLCVVPMYEWIYFQDASDWCLQMRKSQDRHNLAVHKKELHAIQQQPVAAPVVAVAVPHEAPVWLVQQQQGQRLHQLICSHMGVKTMEREVDMKIPEDEAYTLKSGVSLEHKMDALHDILNARHQTSGLGSSLQKMQKVQRFGHIMKLRLHKGD